MVIKAILVTLLFIVPSTAHTSIDLMQEKVGEAVSRQFKLEDQLRELQDKIIPKEYKITVGNVSFVITVFLQKRIEYKTTFP